MPGYLWAMDPQEAKAGIGGVRIRGSRLLLRALQPGEIEEEWRAMVTADPMVIAELPQEAGFKAPMMPAGTPVFPSCGCRCRAWCATALGPSGSGSGSGFRLRRICRLPGDSRRRCYRIRGQNRDIWAPVPSA